jgi:hypothetical protein
LAIFTPVANYLGWPSTDSSSTFLAQIIAWQITRDYLLPRLGTGAYVVEAFLILVLALIISLFLTGLIHLVFKALGGQGSILHSWKATCYGAGSCAILRWVPYWTLFVGAWSFLLQLYSGPTVLYRIAEGRALWILVFFFGVTLLEFATKGTTVGFGG